MAIPMVKIEEYGYDLPEERIAQYPVRRRDGSKLLLYSDGRISEDSFRNISNHIPRNSLLVFNNTRVIRARLLFRKKTGAVIEIFCLEPLLPADYEQSFSSREPVEWKCIIGNQKKWKDRKLASGFMCNGKDMELTAERICPEGDAWRIKFSWHPEDITFSEVTEAAGHIPLPPYIKRNDDDEDNVRYQTIYSRIRGSVAAPTAGLHFTRRVMSDLKQKHINGTDLTLHIGAGTFKPVKTDDITLHEMHCEHFLISRDLIETLLDAAGKTIAVGTTSVRALESLYWLGIKLIKSVDGKPDLNVEQWYPYIEESDLPMEESLGALLELLKRTGEEVIRASTNIIIVPGYRFRVINGMVTNFHQPKSTLLLLISAYTGDDWKRIYSFALENEFRFLSFGDTSLLLK